MSDPAQPKPEESARERIERQRNERTAEAELRRFAAQAEGRSKARPTSPRRAEQLQTRYLGLDAPKTEAPTKKTKAQPSSGTPIEFYCYVNGSPGKIVLLAQSGPEEL